MFPWSWGRSICRVPRIAGCGNAAFRLGPWGLLAGPASPPRGDGHLGVGGAVDLPPRPRAFSSGAVFIPNVPSLAASHMEGSLTRLPRTLSPPWLCLRGLRALTSDFQPWLLSAYGLLFCIYTWGG